MTIMNRELLVLVKTGTDDQPKPTPATEESKNNGDPVKKEFVTKSDVTGLLASTLADVYAHSSPSPSKKLTKTLHKLDVMSLPIIQLP